MRKPLLAGNWKMNKTIDESVALVKELAEKVKGVDDRDILVCPTYPALKPVADAIAGTNINLGAQNIFWEEKGAFTGEVTAPMIRNLGVEYSIIGHTERRKYFGETDEIANLKIKSCLKNDLLPIYCIGESKEERENGSTKKVVTSQIIEGLEGIPKLKLEKVSIVYDPIWAVGTDVLPTSDEMMGIRILIKKILAEKYGIKAAEKVKILYGGSVKAKNVRQICVEPGMDGVLVGRESLIPSELVKIAEIIDAN